MLMERDPLAYRTLEGIWLFSLVCRTSVEPYAATARHGRRLRLRTRTLRNLDIRSSRLTEHVGKFHLIKEISVNKIQCLR